LVIANEINKKPWYHGIAGNWWWGMTKEGFIAKIEKISMTKDS